MRGRRHDHVVALPRRLDAALDAAPAHDRGVRREPALEDLVPPDEALPPGGRACARCAGRTSSAARSRPPGPRPASGPGISGTPSSAPSGTRRRRRGRTAPGTAAATSSITSSSSAEHRVVARAEHVLVDAPRPRDLERPARARELGVRGERGLGVAGHLDLGHHGHVPLGRVGDDVPHLLLRVEAAVTDAVESLRDGTVAAELADHRAGPPRTDLRQLGVPADLDAPALVVGEVPVEHVHLVERQRVDELLHGRPRGRSAGTCRA